MTQAPPAVVKIPTDSPQPARSSALRPAPGRVRASGAGRAAARGGGEVIELEHGITVYPARGESGRWRAVWHEAGKREQCEAATEEKLAAKLEKVMARLAAGAPDMKRPGADLIAYYLAPGKAIKVGQSGLMLAITPNGKTAYASNENSGTVTPITIAANRAGKPIDVGRSPAAGVVTPDGKTLYVANSLSNTVTPISTATNKPGKAIKVGTEPLWIAITP